MTENTSTEPAVATAKKYRIVSGSFRDSDGSIKGVGETIELAEHDAERHAEFLAAIEPPSEAPVAPLATDMAQPE